MTIETAQVAQAWAAIAQAVTAVVGFAFVIAQIWQLKLAIRGETYGKLYEHYLRVSEMLLEKSQLRPAFYRDEPQMHPPAGAVGSTRGTLPKSSEEAVMAEAVLGLLEHAALQKGLLPSASWKECWEAYTLERFRQSPVLRAFFVENRALYAKELWEAAVSTQAGFSEEQLDFLRTSVN